MMPKGQEIVNNFMRKEKIIQVNEREISVVLRRNKLSRTVRLTVAAGGKVTLNMPMIYPEFLALRFLQQKGDWLLRKIDEMEKIKPKISAATERFQYQLYKAKAEKMVKEFVLHYNEHYRQDFRRISVKNQKSRWGSCSTIKNLNFNYRVVFLPQELVAYIVVHELCHLQEMNHSARFWKLVAQTIPNHKILRKKLLTYSQHLI